MKIDGERGTLISPGDGDSAPRTLETEFPESGEEPPLVGHGRGGALDPGEMLAGRFRIVELVQSGGMGDVYLAEDLVSSVHVAVKTLRAGSSSPGRFEREAVRLSELSHQGIPRYIAHDLTSASVPYLVMEWLEGVDLATQLRRGRVGLRTAVSIVRHAADAVAEAHRRGIIHRDLNPNNLFLIGPGDSDVRVLDFGVARLETSDDPLTAEGTQIGTPGYMAPEQIEGKGDVGPPADVFALGCVLYETVTGQRPFYAPTIRELLTKMVSEDPPDAHELNPLVPTELNALLDRVLQKDPNRRPQHAAELVNLLDALPELEDAVPQEPPVGSNEIREQHVTSLIVFRDGDESTFERARRIAQPHGMRVSRSTDDTVVIATHGAGTAGDHATRAARCALSLQRAVRIPQMTLSTGLSLQAGEVVSGRAFDAALVSLMLKDAGQLDEGARGARLWLDENTAALLDSRFDVRAVEQGYLLHGLRETYEPSRTVLGRKTRCVGRKRELSMLEATLTESFEDRMATSILVTGPPGIGKTRISSEITRVARRTISGVQIFRGGSEAMAAGTPFGALSSAIQRACRMRDTEPDSLRRSKLQERLKSLLPAEDCQRVAEFLGEMLGIASERAQSPQFEAARRDAVLRGDQMLRAAEDWLRAECRAHPVLLILDDFQWGDLPTAKFVDSALRNLTELPLVVLALGRPEVHELFPRLWVKRGVTELRLSGLSRRAASEMIEEVLGSRVTPEVVARIVTRAQGNPFWIEELLRAEGAGQGESVPDRIVLLAQSRIEQRSSDERRLLKAASVFGRQFWLSGAKAVLGPQSTNRVVDVVLDDLVEDEFVFEHELSRLGGEREYQFSSSLLRDAAYSLLGEEEREQAHLRAATWLERNGDSDPLAVALHFTLGGEPDRAKPHYLVAAEQALSGDDLDGAISCAEEGLSAGATGRDAVRLRLVHAEASKWRGDNATAFRSAQAAFARAEESTPEWFRAAAEAAVAGGKIGKKETSLAIAQDLLESSPALEAASDHGAALCRVATQMVFMGRTTLARGLLDAVQTSNERLEPDPHVMGFFFEAKAVLAGASDDPVGRIEHAERAVECFEDAGDLRNACLGRLSQGFAEVEFGSNVEALRTLDEALDIASRMNLRNSIPVARAQLGRAMGRLGRVEEATGHLEAAVRAFDRQKNMRLSGMSRLYLAEVLLMSGQIDAALDCVERAAAILEPMPPMRRVALALLAALLAHRSKPGDRERALTSAKEAVEKLAPNESLPVGTSLVRLGAACGLAAAGNIEDARILFEREAANVRKLSESMDEIRRRQFTTGEPARACLMQDPGSPDILDYVRFLRSRSQQDTSADSATLEQMTAGHVERIEREEEPVLRSLWISQSYHLLSAQLARQIDRQNVNWATFACWAAKTAGLSLRREDVPRFAARELGIEQGLRAVSTSVSKLLDWFGLGHRLRNATIETLRDVSAELSLGHEKVHSELAPLFARFVDVMNRNATEGDMEDFVETLRPGPTEDGGQELLKRAFRAWFEASRSDSESKRAQLMLRANCQISLHQQTRLQPHFTAARSAPVSTIVQQKLRQALPLAVSWAGMILVKLGGRPFLREVTRLWERLATRYAMKLALPGGEEVSLGNDVPDSPTHVPPDLRVLDDPKTEALLERFDHRLGAAQGTGANNWADLNDRMAFIVQLLRARQQDLDLMRPPFTPEEEALLAQGIVPDGSRGDDAL